MDSEVTSRSHHDTKYVHNIRLWGRDGQEALERTHVLLLGCTPALSEGLKNLILPGVGRFTMVDARPLTDAERQHNFFANTPGGAASAMPGSLAAAVTEELKGLHAESANTSGVKASVISEDPNVFAANGPALQDFLVSNGVNVILIAASLVTEETLRIIAQTIKDTPALRRLVAVVVHVSGFIGAVRIAVHDVIEVVHTKSEKFFDFRHYEPFPALQAWMEAHAPALVPEEHYSHIPSFCLAYHALKHVSSATPDTNNSGGITVPRNRDGWTAVDTALREVVCKAFLPYGIVNGHTSIMEAQELCTVAKGCPKGRFFPGFVQTARHAAEVLASPEQAAVAAPFWFVVAAIAAFKERHNGHLPLTDNIPDFHTCTEWYVAVHALYKAERQREAEEILATARGLMEAHGRDPSALTITDVAVIAVNSRFLAYSKFVPLCGEYGAEAGAGMPRLEANGEFEPEHDPAGWYVALRLAHSFASSSGRFPGDCADEQLAADTRAVFARHDDAGAFMAVTGGGALGPLEQQVEEVVRGGAAEPIATASAVGAIVAQEVIKIVQVRYVAAGSVVVFDGIKSRTSLVPMSP